MIRSRLCNRRYIIRRRHAVAWDMHATIAVRRHMSHTYVVTCEASHCG